MKNYRTLILGNDYNIVAIRCWKRAFSLVYQGKANQINFYKEKVRDGRGNYYTIPAVIVLKKYVKNNQLRRMKFSKRAVYKRDRYICGYCKRKFTSDLLTIDHVIPCSRYVGDDVHSFTNVVTACKKCNAKKGNLKCEECQMYPCHTLYTPTYLDCLLSDLDRCPEEWGPYINYLLLASKNEQKKK